MVQIHREDLIGKVFFVGAQVSMGVPDPYAQPPVAQPPAAPGKPSCTSHEKEVLFVKYICPYIYPFFFQIICEYTYVCVYSLYVQYCPFNHLKEINVIPVLCLGGGRILMDFFP